MAREKLRRVCNLLEVYVLTSNADFYRSCVELIGENFESLGANLDDFGLLRTLLLYTIYPKAHGVIQRIRLHVLRTREKRKGKQQAEGLSTSEEALSVKNSYTASLSMIAVAGAIAAQIAITALSLANLDRIHWTAEAAFVISLVAGLLSVYYACIIQVQLGGMHASKEVLQWLTTRGYVRRWPSRGTPDKRKVMPSFGAAIRLAAPIQLLNWSLFSLLVGIGIYYGLSSTERLALQSDDNDTMRRGGDANLAILIVYVVFTTGGLLSFVAPSILHLLERTSSAKAEIEEQLDLWRDTRRDAEEGGESRRRDESVEPESYDELLLPPLDFR